MQTVCVCKAATARYAQYKAVSKEHSSGKGFQNLSVVQHARTYDMQSGAHSHRSIWRADDKVLALYMFADRAFEAVA